MAFDVILVLILGLYFAAVAINSLRSMPLRNQMPSRPLDLLWGALGSDLVEPTRTRRQITEQDSFALRTLAVLAGAHIHPVPRRHEKGNSPNGGEDDASEILEGRHEETSKDFRNTVLASRSFAGSDLSNAIFANADLSRANLSRANLAGAILNQANLRGATLERAAAMSALFVGADLGDANLSWVNLSGADLTDANLDDAILDGVTWSTTTVWPLEKSEEILRRSTRVGPETWQILPIEIGDRLLV